MRAVEANHGIPSSTCQIRGRGGKRRRRQGWLFCSRNARSQTTLVGRAQAKPTLPLHWEFPGSSFRGGRGREGHVRAFRQWFMNYGLVASIFVSTALVAVLAYRLEGSRWRWPMVALALAGLGTVAGIFWIRRYIDRQPKQPDQEVK